MVPDSIISPITVNIYLYSETQIHIDFYFWLCYKTETMSQKSDFCHLLIWKKSARSSAHVLEIFCALCDFFTQMALGHVLGWTLHVYWLGVIKCPYITENSLEQAVFVKH